MNEKEKTELAKRELELLEELKEELGQVSYCKAQEWLNEADEHLERATQIANTLPLFRR